MGDFKNSTFVHKYKWPSWLPNHREITDYTLNCQVDFNSFFFLYVDSQTNVKLPQFASLIINESSKSGKMIQ